MSILRQSTDDNLTPVEQFYNAASSFTQEQLDAVDVREGSREYIVVTLYDGGTITSVSGYEICAVKVGYREHTTVLYKPE